MYLLVRYNNQKTKKIQKKTYDAQQIGVATYADSNVKPSLTKYFCRYGITDEELNNAS